ncbi:MAG: cation diffusion facilitator family transporter [Candidatus Bathyarchaeia archaeon]
MVKPKVKCRTIDCKPSSPKISAASDNRSKNATPSMEPAENPKSKRRILSREFSLRGMAKIPIKDVRLTSRVADRGYKNSVMEIILNMSWRLLKLITVGNDYVRLKWLEMRTRAAPEDDSKHLTIALAVTVIFFIIELAGGYLTNSLALITDAWHMLNDALALTFALVASWIASRPIDTRKTYGYYRVEILAAFLNGVFLCVLITFIIYEAVHRVQNPIEVNSLGMLSIAAMGLVANGLSAAILSRSRSESMNVKGAFLHVIADTLGSLGAIGAGAVMYFTGWYQADSIISILIGIFVFYGSGRLIIGSINILLEGVPFNIDLDGLKMRIKSLEGVKDIHDLHVWCITPSKMCCMSGHVVVDGDVDRRMMLVKIMDILKSEFGIDHVTIQLEDEGYPKAAGEH